jgi:hypothetical protein
MLRGRAVNCNRCGILIAESVIERRRARGNMSTTCQDCTAKKTKRIKYNGDYCEPHHGAFTDDDEPLDDYGNRILPGPRVCNHKDCVRPSHCPRQTPLPLELELFDMSYRTGIKLDADAMLQRLERERNASV